MASSFHIPGNIKQQYLPFVLNPERELNKNAKSSSELLGNIGAQYFSFRNRNKSVYKAGFGRIQICPSSLTNVNFGSYFNDDISFKTLYGELSKENRKNTPLTVDDIFNALPGVQIREFLPDTKLDQCINFFGDMIQSVKDLWESSDDQQKQKIQDKKDELKGKKYANAAEEKAAKRKVDKEIKEIQKSGFSYRIKQFKAILWHAFDYMTGMSNPNLYSNMSGGGKYGGNRLGIYGDSQVDRYLLTFPYMLYYRLQSCVTTNVYELPCNIGDGLMYSSKGNAGWEGGKGFGVGNGLISKIPIIGGILDNILGNVQINYMPWWDAKKGSGTQPPEVAIKFDLFNDTYDAAMLNFIFVNTIVPNNMWVQYNMFQHSSNLYDVKIEGYNRLFACSGHFEVKAKGVMRNPPPAWVDYLCTRYGNGGHGGKDAGGNINVKALAEMIKKNNLIKIPDVYEVTLTFESLLPLNFNNYLFTYSQNNTMETEYAESPIYQEGAMTTVLKAATTDFISEMTDFISNKDNKMTNAIEKADREEAAEKKAIDGKKN